MNYIIRYIGVLLLLFTVALASIRVIGTHGPASSFALLFTYPDRSPCPGPCMFGIQLDKTSYDDAVELLHLHPLTRHLHIGTGVLSTGSGIRIYLTGGDGGKVTQINVLLRQSDYSKWSPLNEASVGDMVATLGSPDFVRLDLILVNQGSITYWFYHGRWLIVNIEHPLSPGSGNGLPTLDSLRTQDQVVALIMGGYAKQPVLDPLIFKIAGWHGFASLRRYTGCFGKSMQIDCVASN